MRFILKLRSRVQEFQEINKLREVAERVGLTGGVAQDGGSFRNRYTSRHAPSLDGRFSILVAFLINLRIVREVENGLKRLSTCSGRCRRVRVVVGVVRVVLVTAA